MLLDVVVETSRVDRVIHWNLTIVPNEHAAVLSAGGAGDVLLMPILGEAPYTNRGLAVPELQPCHFRQQLPCLLVLLRRDEPAPALCIVHKAAQC